jgi:DNA invertase Pin-like site-specific DNA recombinase
MDGHGMEGALPMAASQLNLHAPRHQPVLLPLPRASEGVGRDITLIGQLGDRTWESLWGGLLNEPIGTGLICKTYKFHKISLDAENQGLMICESYLQIWARKMPVVGYARVSTRDQDLTAQLDALKVAGAEATYREKVSGVRADRPQLAKLMAKLLPGDVVVVTKLDRLGRSTRELLELIERIGKAGAAFRSLGDTLFDTTGAQGRLLVTMLAAIAEFERELIKERTGAGRERAMVEGVKFGRPRKLSDYQRAEAVARRAAGETLAAIAKSYGVDISMISRL